MAGDWDFEKRTFWEFWFYFDCAPASLWTTKLLVMAFNFNWFIKINRSFGSGFQIQDCKARSKTDHDWEQIWNRLSYQIRLRNTLVVNCRLNFSLPTVFFILLVLCLYFYVSGTNGLTFPGRRYCFLIPIPIPIPRQHLLLHVVIFGAMLTPGFFHFSASSSVFSTTSWVEISIVPCEISIASSPCWASFRSTVRRTQGNMSSQPCCSFHSMIAPGSSQLCAFSCK